jgi:hypothetical protein
MIGDDGRRRAVSHEPDHQRRHPQLPRIRRLARRRAPRPKLSPRSGASIVGRRMRGFCAAIPSRRSSVRRSRLWHRPNSRPFQAVGAHHRQHPRTAGWPAGACPGCAPERAQACLPLVRGARAGCRHRNNPARGAHAPGIIVRELLGYRAALRVAEDVGRIDL